MFNKNIRKLAVFKNFTMLVNYVLIFNSKATHFSKYRY